MRSWVPGMDELDYTILEYFEALGTPGGKPVAKGPTAVWVNLADLREATDKKRNTVSRHMQTLAHAGLLEKYDEDRGYYIITDLGRRCAQGDLTDEEREEIAESMD